MFKELPRGRKRKGYKSHVIFLVCSLLLKAAWRGFLKINRLQLKNKRNTI